MPQLSRLHCLLPQRHPGGAGRQRALWWRGLSSLKDYSYTLVKAKAVIVATGGIDLHHQPLLIYLTLHYQNGGVVVDGAGRCHQLDGAVKVLESSLYHFMDGYERSICN